MLYTTEERVLNGLMDAIADRQQILANNLTNTNTPGFVRQDMDFVSVIHQLKKENSNLSLDQIINQATYHDDSKKASYETELAAMAKNHLYYVLLSRIDGGYYKTLDDATQSGRAA